MNGKPRMLPLVVSLAVDHEPSIRPITPMTGRRQITLRVLGASAEVRISADEGVAYGGPEGRPQAAWRWGVFAGPSQARRRAVLGLVDAGTLDDWCARAHRTARIKARLGVSTLFGHYLVALDEVGPFIEGFAASDVVKEEPAGVIYRELSRAAARLRQAAAVDLESHRRS
jgi:hypothetical protein